MDLILFQNFAVALILSVLVGLEREHKYQQSGVNAFGGVRTFALIGLLGAISYMLSTFLLIFSVVLLAGFLILVASSYVMSVRNNVGVGGTSEIAAILVYLIGFLSGMGHLLLATSIALVVLSVLHFKTKIHQWAKDLRDKEIISTIQFILIAFVILPLLPNVNYGPFEFFNPYVVWLMVVLISGLSYLSYIAIRLFGQKRGIGVTGFLAGFISSTALVMSFSGQSRENKNVVNPYVIAVVVASSAMFFRILVELLIVNKALFNFVLWPMVTMGGVGILSVLYFWLKQEKVSKKVKDHVLALKSPFNLAAALKFGAFFALILFLSKFLNSVWGDSGLYVASVFSGILDVDAITVSMGNLALSGLDIEIAAYAVILAAMTNTLVKGMMFLFLGSRRVALRIVFVFLLMILSGFSVCAFLY